MPKGKEATYLKTFRDVKSRAKKSKTFTVTKRTFTEAKSAVAMPRSKKKLPKFLGKKSKFSKLASNAGKFKV